MSAQIRLERDAYYNILERTQTGLAGAKPSLDITPWMDWFLACLGGAIRGAQTTLKSVLIKARFWETFAETPLNPRQREIVNRLLDGFEGKLNTSKYARITACSQDTALRDILALVEMGMLARGGEGGRSTSYALRAVN
jgi:Fic family protein